MKTRIIHGKGANPYRNLAFEETLVEEAEAGEEEVATLFLWQNHDTVVIGCNQNPWRECDLLAMERDGVHLARRVTGGGAVFHDKGNLNFSFVVPKRLYDVKRQGNIILSALAERGLSAELTGRNDITLEGRKFSGNAFLHRRKTSLHHGTLLIGADMSRLTGYLHVDREKLSGKGVHSVRARVTNLNEWQPGLDVNQMKELLSRHFARDYGPPEIVETVDLSSSTTLPAGAAPLLERNQSWEWLYGKTPAFDLSLSRRFPWGTMELGLGTRRAVVEQVRLWSDCLWTDFPKKLEEALQGVRLDKRELSRRLMSNPWEDVEAGLAWQEVRQWLEETQWGE